MRSYKCDACGEYFYNEDLRKGAALSIPDQPETDNLCVKCNSENENNVSLLQSA